MERDFIPLLSWNGTQPYQIYKELITTLEEDTQETKLCDIEEDLQLCNLVIHKVSKMLIYILCMYFILSILIAMGKSIQFPKPESKIRFGWGISYNYIGQMHHNLNKYDVVVGFEILDFRVIPYYQPFSRDPKYCNKWNTGIRTKLLFETCQKIWPAYIGTIAKLDNSQERIKHIMEKEIPAVVPDFKLRPAPTETTKGQPNAKRVKRFITDLLSLGIQGFSAFYQNRKQNKLKKGMEKLFERQNKLNNRVIQLDNDMISLARTTLMSLDHFQKELVRQGEHIKHLTNRVKHVEMAMQHHDHQITDNRNSIKYSRQYAWSIIV